MAVVTNLVGSLPCLINKRKMNWEETKTRSEPGICIFFDYQLKEAVNSSIYTLEPLEVFLSKQHLVQKEHFGSLGRFSGFEIKPVLLYFMSSLFCQSLSQKIQIQSI